MEEEFVTVEKGNNGSRKRKKGFTSRQTKTSKRYGDPDPGLQRFKRPCTHNGKTYKCVKIKLRDVRTARKRFYEDSIKTNQDIRLCHILSVAPINRRRHNKDLAGKNLSIAYFIPIGGSVTRVCQSFFTAVLGITKHRINTVAKVLLKGGVPKEGRGGDRISHKTADKKNHVRSFIKRLKGRESHYNRKKSKRIYLSATLSIAKLHKMFNEQASPESRVSYFMFRKIFIGEFNIGFSSPASDICSKCNRLKQQYNIETNEEKKMQLLLEYRVHRKRASAFYSLAKETPERSITFCFDLQQVQPLPRTPIGDAFYAHQISLYAFCCVGMSSRNPNFYVWTEDLAGRGSTEIGSALLDYLQSLDYDGVCQIRLFCDGCAGQNKNSHILHALMFWLKHKSPNHVSEIMVTFPVRGHSFMAADRCFGRVERLLRKTPEIISKEEYVRFYSEVGNVKLLGQDWQLYNIKAFEKVYKKIKGIANTKRIVIKKFEKKGQAKANVKVTAYEFYRFQSNMSTAQTLIKKGQCDNNLKLQQLGFRHCLPEKKKASLRHLMQENFGEEWDSRADLEWYKNLLTTTSEEAGEDEDNNGERCDCLFEEPAVHI